MDLQKAIQNRKSVRKFSSKKPDWRDIIEAIESARHAPCAGGNFPLKFILVSNKNKINQIAKASQQDFIKQAQYLVAACTDIRRVKNLYGDEAGEKYSRQQAGAAIQNFLLSIEEKNLSTCWVGHFVEEQIKEILEIPDNTNVEAVFPIGYELKKEKPRKKPEMDSIIFFDKYKGKKMSGAK